MNSTISDDLTRDNLALGAAKCTQNIFDNNQNLTLLHKELLEINLSVTAYIEESKRRLAGLKLDLANEAKTSHKVVEILSEKCKYISQNKIMSQSPSTPQKQNLKSSTYKKSHKDNGNCNDKFTEREQAKSFVSWYKQMIDNERQNLGLYLSDDAVLEWFGRTIKTRKKVSAFLKYDMQCSKHDLVSVQCKEKIQSREEKISRKEEDILNLGNSPEVIRSRTQRIGKRRFLRSNCSSPEWAEGCQPADEIKEPESKKLKKNNAEHEEFIIDEKNCQINSVKRSFSTEDIADVNSKGDGVLGRRVKRKLVPVTPPNCEVGQGDCMPSTSGTGGDRPHETFNAPLPKLFVECTGYIEFTRTRNSRSTDSMKWERKCKLQISYSEDPLNIGEYIIWEIHYTDESKCRRNLLPAFEEVAMEEEKKTLIDS